MVLSAPALTTGAALGTGSFTVTVITLKAERFESSAISRSTYVPDVENMAVVEAALGLANVTVPGPELCSRSR